MKPKGHYDAAYHRRVQLRIRLFKKHCDLVPAARGVRGAARKALLDQLEREYKTPRVWRWRFDHPSPGGLGWVSDRPAFELYKRAVNMRARQLRAQRHHDTARILDAHLKSLQDLAPREAWCYYPAEWQEISRALRPQGSSPRHPAARRLLVIYQHIIRTKVEERMS